MYGGCTVVPGEWLKSLAVRGLVLLAGGIAALTLGASPANADAINVRPWTDIVVGAEQTLQDVLDFTVVAGPRLDVLNLTAPGSSDQSEFALFTSPAGQSVATIIIEVAGFQQQNMFGLYSEGQPGNLAQIFDGASSIGDVATVEFMLNGDVIVNSTLAATGFGANWGFYITTPQSNTFFSEDSLNPGGLAQALIFQGEGLRTIAIPGQPLMTFDPDQVMLAFEDLNIFAGGSDKDFQDMVLLVDTVQPIPEPGSLLLLGAGLAGAIALRRRLA